MDTVNLQNRAYDSTALGTLQPEKVIDSDDRNELLFLLYDQVCSAWKTLIDVRFKLLGLVPTVSIVLITAILSTKAEGLSFVGKLLISLVGALATLGLFVYDKRNSALHDDLISRGRKIEEELGIETGIFKGRLKPNGIVSHGTATNLVYFPTLTAWAATIILTIIFY